MNEAKAYDCSDYLNPSKSSRNSTSGRRRRPGRRSRAFHGTDCVDSADVLCDEEDPLSLSSDELRGRDTTRESMAALPTRPRSHGDGGSTTQGRKRALPAATGSSGLGTIRAVGGHAGGTTSSRTCTWRGRLEGSDRRGHEKGPGLSSGKKFEDLDDYLRGSAATAAGERAKRKRCRFAREKRGGRGDGSGSTITAHSVEENSSVEANGYEVSTVDQT